MALATIAGLLAIGLFVVEYRGQFPRIEEPLEASEIETLVADRLAQASVPRWLPGVDLSTTPVPTLDALGSPPSWLDTPAWDATPRRHASALRAAAADLETGRTVAAITRYLTVARAAPEGWYPRYQAGLALLERGDFGGASEVLGEALERLEALPPDGPDSIAARISTHLALGAATLPDDCVTAIHQLKRAVGALGPYRQAAGILVYDRALPFSIDSAGLENFDVWLALVDGYSHCPHRYPREYMQTYSEATPFIESEFPQLPENEPSLSYDQIENGPFPEELVACIEAARAALHGESARCWALSNLNQLYYKNRSSYPEPRDSKNRLHAVEHPTALARLAYAVAWMLAQHEESRRRAPRYLEQARLLAVQAEDPTLEERVLVLGRHLAPLTDDYSVLAGAYRGASPERLELDEHSPPEEVLGIASHLVERWRGMIRRGRTEEAFDEFNTFQLHAGPYGPSLRDWRAALQENLRTELVEEMRQARANGNLARAIALRDYGASYLGEEWKTEAAHGWRPYGRWSVLAILWLLVVVLFLGIHRFVVYPYMMYTTDFYRLEFARRHREAKEADRLFTRKEVEERQIRPV